MHPTLLHLYGPFEINSYGLAIAIGLMVFLKLTINHPTRKLYMSKDSYLKGITEGALIGIIGGRLLHVISEWGSYSNFIDIISIWNGGLSILGTIISVFVYAAWFLTRHNIPMLPVLDLITLYAPLVHAISRIGCFLAGCCYGKPSILPWSIIYTNPESIAPLHIQLHPTQLYSAVIYLAIFGLLYYISRYPIIRPGQIAMLYLMLQSLERLLVDFFRGDRIATNYYLSFHQWLAIAIFIAALGGFVSLLFVPKVARQHEPV